MDPKRAAQIVLDEIVTPDQYRLGETKVVGRLANQTLNRYSSVFFLCSSTNQLCAVLTVLIFIEYAHCLDDRLRTKRHMQKNPGNHIDKLAERTH